MIFLRRSQYLQIRGLHIVLALCYDSLYVCVYERYCKIQLFVGDSMHICAQVELMVKLCGRGWNLLSGGPISSASALNSMNCVNWVTSWHHPTPSIPDPNPPFTCPIFLSATLFFRPTLTQTISRPHLDLVGSRGATALNTQPFSPTRNKSLPTAPYIVLWVEFC